MHWCADEQMVLVAFLTMIPFLGPWLKNKIKKWRDPHCCKEEHNAGVQR